MRPFRSCPARRGIEAQNQFGQQPVKMCPIKKAGPNGSAFFIYFFRQLSPPRATHSCGVVSAACQASSNPLPAELFVKRRDKRRDRTGSLFRLLNHHPVFDVFYALYIRDEFGHQILLCRIFCLPAQRDDAVIRIDLGAEGAGRAMGKQR